MASISLPNPFYSYLFRIYFVAARITGARGIDCFWCLGINHQLADRTRIIGLEKRASRNAIASDKLRSELENRVEELESENFYWKKQADQLRDLPLEDVAWHLGLDRDPKIGNKWKGQGHAIEIVKQVLGSNIRNVAERNDLSESEIQSMLDYLESEIRIDVSEIKRLGIDEIALIKGQGNYLGVLVDLDKRKPIDIVESRRQSEMSQALQSLGNEVLEQIEEVSIDL
jgi:Transposase